MKYCVIALLLLGFQQPAAAASTRLHYVAYAAGFRVLDLSVDLALSEDDYSVGVALRTVGVFSAMVSGATSTEVLGGWDGLAAVPHHYASRGVWRGEQVRTVIDYQPTGPHIRELLPDPDPEPREKVPSDQTTSTIDTLSSMAAVVRRVSRTGTCDATARTFDGRRLSEIVAHTVGPEELPASSRSIFHGPALRCDFQGRLLAGLRIGEDPARETKPHAGSAWFAALVPGGPLLPVRVTFETRYFGNATMYLVPPQ